MKDIRNKFNLEFLSKTLFLLVSFVAAIHGKSPNILLILADDVGFGDIPANYPEALVPMPNIQQLAEMGVRFLDAHSTSAVCAPTRYSLLSGNYPWRGRRPYGTWHYNGGSQFKKNQLSLAQVLKDAGYHTAMFGKVHLGAHVHPRDPRSGFNEQWNPPVETLDFTRTLVGGPKDLGFDYSFTTPAGIQDKPYVFFENDLMTTNPNHLRKWVAGEYPNDNGVSKISPNHDGFGAPGWESNNYAIELTNKVMAFLDRHLEKNQANGQERPFFIHYCAEAVHVPHSPPKKYFDLPVMGQTPSAHLDMLHELDLTVGKLIREIEARGMLENTLVIFTSDNGGLGVSDHLGHDASGGYRDNKGSIYEGGHRIPMIMSWPAGGVPHGLTYDSLTGIQDLYRTLAELADTKVPDGQALDSISFKEQLMGLTDQPHRRNQMTQTVENSGELAYRKDEWKLIMDASGKPFALYNLSQDFAEEMNLFHEAEHASRKQQLQSEFLALNPVGVIQRIGAKRKKK